ncbi:MAG: acetyl-coenzyme A synthetase N-terminal domain-containing protein, partial [Bacteroidia bacterium]
MSNSYQIKTQAEYDAAWKKSTEQPAEFWAEIASNFRWRKKWDITLDWNFAEPHVRWFLGGKLNITENCIDRHLAERGSQPAIIWESNNPAEANRVLTYKQLHEKVCQFS